jgi:hypothetical protein
VPAADEGLDRLDARLGGGIGRDARMRLDDGIFLAGLHPAAKPQPARPGRKGGPGEIPERPRAEVPHALLLSTDDLPSSTTRQRERDPALPAHLHTGCHASRTARGLSPEPGASPAAVGAEPNILRRVPAGAVLRFATHRFTR